jgi:hypothetical protein
MDEWRFTTPGNVDQDLPREVLDAWHLQQAADAEGNIASMVAVLRESNGDPTIEADDVAYVLPAGNNLPAARTTASVGWEGFPERVLNHDDELDRADHIGTEDRPGTHFADGTTEGLGVRDRQDEYLEWLATQRDGVLDSVTFVCEGYDYYSFLFNSGGAGRARVVELYRRFLGDDSIDEEDLAAPDDILNGAGKVDVPKGAFNHRNQLNQTRGIVHLSHTANSLGAEVNLAVTAAIPLTRNGVLIDGMNAKKLMCASSAGNPNRSSDPRIAAAAYKQVTSSTPSRFTLTNPVGLYIRDFAWAALSIEGKPTPTFEQLVHIERGTPPQDADDPSDSRILRLRVEVDPSLGYRLGDMEINGAKITHGGQIAKLITMHLRADFWPAGREPFPSMEADFHCCEQNGELDVVGAREVCPPGCDPFPDLLRTDPLPQTGRPHAGLTR